VEKRRIEFNKGIREKEQDLKTELRLRQPAGFVEFSNSVSSASVVWVGSGVFTVYGLSEG
jgi:hypothetical protein